jgi:hypothetical protein
MVSQQCQVEFKIGGYKDEILCDVIPMDVCHILLGRCGHMTGRLFMMEGRIPIP